MLAVRLPAPEEAPAIRWLMSREAARRRDELGAVFNRVMLSRSLLTAIQQYARSAMSNGLPPPPHPPGGMLGGWQSGDAATAAVAAHCAAVAAIGGQDRRRRDKEGEEVELGERNLIT